jgi:hypothetical protein
MIPRPRVFTNFVPDAVEKQRRLRILKVFTLLMLFLEGNASFEVAMSNTAEIHFICFLAVLSLPIFKEG